MDPRTTRQRTLETRVACRGVGLHTGAPITMALAPAPVDSGVRIRRRDVGKEFAANWRNLVPSELCTTLGRDGVTVATVEHLMSAFAGLEIDNVVVELDGPEVPAMDGSALPFIDLIDRAGLVEQTAPRRAIRVLKPIRVEAGGASVTLEPADRFSLNFAIDFASGAIRRQRIGVTPDPIRFRRDIGSARTFGFLEEVEQMRKAGLALGGSLDNAIVISGDRVLNDGGLRFTDEFVRHKVLDAMGDLYLAGGPIVGRFSGTRSGHALNHRLVERLFADSTAWAYTTLPALRDAAWTDAERERASA